MSTSGTSLSEPIITHLDYFQYIKLHPNFTGVFENSEGRFWLRNGIEHREDGPATEWASGSKEWFQNGKQHREDGPAVEYADGREAWYLRGQIVSEEEHKNWVRNKKLETFLDD